MTREMNKEFLCKDCVHGFVSWSDWPNHFFEKSPFYMKCKKTGVRDEHKFNPIHGYTTKDLKYKKCIEERGYSGNCGPSATRWSPKHKKDLFKVLTKD